MFRGKRAFLANVLYYAQLHRALRAFDRRRLTIFNFHRTCTGDDQPRAFDDGVFGPPQDMLRKQLRWLKLNMDLISEKELIDHIYHEKKIPNSCAMITFDDGYRDNADLALPIIRELKIPAIFFISTQAIQDRTLGWWDAIAFLVKQSKHSNLTLRGKTFYLAESGSPERRVAIREIQNWMRKLNSEVSRSLISELSMACDVALPDHKTCSRELMTWGQIREVIRAGATIGSHTHTHRVLSTLSPSDQIAEFSHSKQILEKEIGREIHSIAYPVGTPTDLHPETEKLAERCGYLLGFSFQTGANHLDRLNPHGICRVAGEDTLSLLCATVTAPSIFARPRATVRNSP